MTTNTVTAKDATFTLGVVTINEKQYLAILHFKNDLGEPRAVPVQVKNSPDVALRFFNAVLADRLGEVPSLINRVSAQGFHASKDKAVEFKTGEAWGKFIVYLNNPMPDEAYDWDELNVELLDLTELEEIEDKEEFGKALYKKIFDAQKASQPFPQFSDLEKLFLKAGIPGKTFPNLIKGDFNLNELQSLQSSVLS